MCRIAGIADKALSPEILLDTVRQMCFSQKHGGPDDEGFYSDTEQHLVLGHRRLALIDLSSAGKQPLSYLDTFYISFNGEIYNYAELRQQLLLLGHVFNTHTDTEVILAAYAEWGWQGFLKLKGMYAFALWDSVENELLLVRDPSGIKPLYYAVTANGISFASEVRAFRHINAVSKENKHWPVYQMAYGFLPEPLTTLEQVRPVPKGCYIKYKIRTSQVSLHHFRHYSFSDSIKTKKEAEEHIKDTLINSVKSHLIADAPIGVFLSGGIDSGILFLLAAMQKKDQLNSLSLYFNEENYSEKKYQDLLLKKVVYSHNNQYKLEAAEFFESLPTIIDDMDLPSCDGINTWFISKYARMQGLKAVLSGIGADELLGGYPSFTRMPLADMLQKIPSPALAATDKFKVGKYKRAVFLKLEGIKGIYLFLRGQFTPAQIAVQLDASEKEIWQILNDMPVLQTTRWLTHGNRASWMELNMYMQNQLLRDADVMSMAHGLEIRVPFLDDEFIQICHSINSDVKYKNDLPKHLLINSFKDILPEAIWDRPKMGFSFPFTEWFRQSLFVRELMMSGSPIYQKSYGDFINGHLHWYQLLSLIIIQKRLYAA